MIKKKERESPPPQSLRLASFTVLVPSTNLEKLLRVQETFIEPPFHTTATLHQQLILKIQGGFARVVITEC
jgi:hypothetical protein